MLPQFGLGEMIIILLLAIIVVGPKDLPKVMRTLGGFMAKIRMMGQEFKDAFDEMDADDEIKALRKEIAEMKNMGFLGDDIGQDMRELDRDLRRDTSEMSSPKASSPAVSDDALDHSSDDASDEDEPRQTDDPS